MKSKTAAIILTIMLFAVMTENVNAQKSHEQQCQGAQCYTLKEGALVIINSIHVIKLVNLIETSTSDVGANYVNELVKNKYAYITTIPMTVYKIDQINPSRYMPAYKLKSNDGREIGWVLDDNKSLVKIKKNK